MPKTLLSRPKNKYAKLLDLINGRAKTDGVTNPELSTIIGRSKTVIYDRLKSPENFTIGELAKLGRALSIPIEELRQAITY